MRKIWLCLLLLALLGTLLSGCMRRVEAQGYDVYYVEQSAGAASALVPEKHPLPSGRPSVEGLVDLLLSRPQREDLTSAIPEGVTLRKWTLYNGLLTVDFTSGYGTLSGIDLTLADYCVTLTLTQISAIRSVSILVRGQELSYRDSQRFRPKDVLRLTAEDAWVLAEAS